MAALEIQSNLKCITSGNVPTTTELANSEFAFGVVGGDPKLYGNVNGTIVDFTPSLTATDIQNLLAAGTGIRLSINQAGRLSIAINSDGFTLLDTQNTGEATYNGAVTVKPRRVEVRNNERASGYAALQCDDLNVYLNVHNSDGGEAWYGVDNTGSPIERKSGKHFLLENNVKTVNGKSIYGSGDIGYLKTTNIIEAETISDLDTLVAFCIDHPTEVVAYTLSTTDSILTNPFGQQVTAYCQVEAYDPELFKTVIRVTAANDSGTKYFGTGYLLFGELGVGESWSGWDCPALVSVQKTQTKSITQNTFVTYENLTTTLKAGKKYVVAASTELMSGTSTIIYLRMIIGNLGAWNGRGTSFGGGGVCVTRVVAPTTDMNVEIASYGYSGTYTGIAKLSIIEF